MSIQAQVLLNQVWTTNSGQPDEVNFAISEWGEIDRTTSVATGSGDLIIVGNTIQSTTDTDILLIKQNGEGQIVWEQTFSGTAGGYDYGLAVTLDNNQNILVAGVVSTSNQTTDIVLLKYSSSGSLLWSSIIDAGSNQFDIATSLVCDASNNIYLVGGTVSSFTLSDWYITKFSSTGTQIWNTTYDYANLHELPVAVKTIGGGNIAVSGFSNSSSTVWDFTHIRFSGTTGSVLSENREEIPDLAISDAVATAFEEDNIYIAGTTSGITAEGKDIQLVKINGDFDIEWIKKVDAEGLDDRGKSIAIDSEGNIVVAGNSQKENGGTQITVSKFSPDGEVKLRTEYLAPATFEVAEVSKVKVNNAGDIFITGSVERNGNRDFVTLMYDSEGTLRIEKYFSGEGETKDIAKNIEVTDSGEILVTGKSEGDEVKYTTVKYETLKRSDEVVLIEDKPHHKANEFIVKFFPDYVNTDFVDDKSKRYGNIFDILKTEAAEKMAERFELRGATFAKVFPRLSTLHTHSTTRLGETIPIPEFWSVFLVVLEGGQSIDDLMAEFEGMTDFVVYAHPNHVYQKQTIPNDNFFLSNDQSSLFPSVNFPDAHINVEPAWDLETGQNYTKVGVFDDVIFWSHEDLGDGTFEGSQVVGGWSFNGDGTNITGITSPESHGTACAGIIGAIRDNNTGISGIAGGGLDAEGNDNEGVQLFSLGIFDGGYAGDDAVGPAIVEGAMFSETQNPPGYGLHIQNHSWGGPDPNTTIRNAVEFCYRNQCVFVAARGNEGNDDLLFPACYNDNWVVNVGAAGTNGEYFDGGNGNAWATGPLGNDGGSSFGGDVDFIAPGVSELITSLINPDEPFTEDWGSGDVAPAAQGADNNYQSFYRTSSAAPHVAGVSALMHSFHHINKGYENNLAPEDVEFLLQRYADDIAGGTNSYPIGYDDNNGWGRINAFEVIQRLEAPRWRVFHSGQPDNVNETTSVDNVITIPIPIGNLPAGNYNADRVQVTHTYLDIFSPSTQIVDNWERLSSTIGVSAANPVGGNTFADFDFVIEDNVASVTVTTFAWHVTQGLQGNIDVWIPAPPEDIRTAYSLHLFDPTATSTDNFNDESVFNIYPNPSEGIFNIEYFNPDEGQIVLELYSLTGQQLQKIELPDTFVNTRLDLSRLSDGVYFCLIVSEKGIQSKKIIKN